MLLIIVVVAATAVLVMLWVRVPGRKTPLPGTMSDQWMAEHRIARRW